MEDEYDHILNLTDAEAEAQLEAELSTFSVMVREPDRVTWTEHYSGKPRTLVEWFQRRRDRALQRP